MVRTSVGVEFRSKLIDVVEAFSAITRLDCGSWFPPRTV
jgi:hypothetical protein